MAITSYSGVMGAGKTYEVVAYVLVPAVCAGRRVVTNIAGISTEELTKFCEKKYAVDPINLGSVISVSDDDISAPMFFPTPDVPGFVQPGDLVIFDEAWKFWSAGSKISPEHMSFFRLHRHFVHSETKVSCDLVLISQDIADLHRSVRTVIELSFRAKKLKVLGLYSRYAVEMWEGSKQTRKSVKSQTRKYDPSVFPIYKSYSGGSGPGKELVVDSRQNLAKSWKVIIGIPFLILFAIICFTYSFSFFCQGSAVAAGSIAHSSDKEIGAAPRQTSTNNLIIPRKIPRISPEWRLAGYFSVGDRKLVILVNNSGRVRYELPGAFSFEDGRPVAGIVDDERVTPWSGSLTAADTVRSPLASSILKD